MKENQIQIHYNTYQWEELSESYKNLMDRSIAAQKNAYAPYSNFKVGAAILLEDGTIQVFEKNPDHYYDLLRSYICLLYTSPSPRDPKTSRMPSSA